MSRENVEIIRRIYDEWGKGNLRAGVDAYDQWVVFIPRGDLPDAGQYFGVDSVKAWTRRWLQEWTNFRIAAEDIIEAGDSVIVATRQEGEGRESGASAELRYFQVWSFRGPRVIRIEQFGNRAEALEAVGLRE